MHAKKGNNARAKMIKSVPLITDNWIIFSTFKSYHSAAFETHIQFGGSRFGNLNIEDAKLRGNIG